MVTITASWNSTSPQPPIHSSTVLSTFWGTPWAAPSRRKRSSSERLQPASIADRTRSPVSRYPLTRSQERNSHICPRPRSFFRGSPTGARTSKFGWRWKGNPDSSAGSPSGAPARNSRPEALSRNRGPSLPSPRSTRPAICKYSRGGDGL